MALASKRSISTASLSCSSDRGFMRQMFPKFVADIEFGRYLRTLLVTGHYTAVRVEPHRNSDGSPSTHVFDVYRLET
jgi:hypothetical protein